MIRFDQHLWHRCKAIAVPYWFGEDKWPARGLLALLVLLLLGQTGVDVLFNHLTGEFTSALAARDADRFWNSIKLCLAVLIGLNFYQLKREADFRFSLVRIRENAEAIAFYRGEAQESRQVGG